jgi:hypothetical protein
MTYAYHGVEFGLDIGTGRKIGIGITRLTAIAEPAQSKQSLNCWLSGKCGPL